MTKKNRRDKRKRKERAHTSWLNEQLEAQERPDKRAGEFVVLLWPNMEQTKPLNWTEAEKIWRNHTDRAMIFLASDFTCKTRSPN